MSTITNKARLHEHAGRVALNFEGQPTIYLTWMLAEKLANELKLAASQIQNANHYPTTEVTNN